MAMQDAPRPATPADLEELPEDMVGQIVYGTLHAHPRPAPRHSRAQHRLSGEIDGPFDRGTSGPGGWIFLTKPELHLGPHIFVPDIAGWKRDRLTPFPETAYVETPPDWVCQVLSPATAKVDRTDKVKIYADFGVPHAWYVDPDARTLEAFALQDRTWLLMATFKDAEPVTAPPFEVHTFPLSNLWPPEPPPED
ncbi:MAG: Uma2 family endonuclease [Pseudomonadota bacterium]